MRRSMIGSLWLFLLFVQASVFAQEEGGKDLPVLKIKTFGPASYVSALSFSPDGKTLYAGGWDKVIRVWQLNDESGQFEYLPDRAFRLPIGPGLFGGVNSISVSADGQWLAISGRWPMRGLSGFRDKTAWLLPSAALTEEQRLDTGSIYVFNTNDRTARILRGHNAPAISLEFATGTERAILVSAAERAIDNGFSGAVHVWDVADRKLLAKLERVPVPRAGVSPTQWKWQNLPNPAGQTPGLAAWQAGAGANNIRVAFAWGDNDNARNRGLFRIWDARTGQVSTAESGRYPLVVKTLAATVAGQELFAAAHRQLGIWTVPPGRQGSLPGISSERNFTAFPHLGDRDLPTRATLFATRPGGALDAAAVVVQSQPDRKTARLQLQLVDLADRQPRGARILIQEGALSELRQPSVAATGQGSFLAVAGSKDDAIRVYQIRKLIAGDAGNPQVLSGSGTSWQRVAFIKKGDALGLKLNTSAGNQNQQLQFDITNRTVIDNAEGWQNGAVSPDEWRAVHDAAGRRIQIIKGQDDFGKAIPDPTDRVITAFAVVPPGDHSPVPLVAVATHRLGEPRLSIYDGVSGKELRQFAGHLERIRNLSVSADGRMIASVADDRTVRLWWVADIGETRGTLGRVSGLLVKEQDGRIVVARVEQDSQVAGKLRAGDVVVSAQTPDGPATFKTRYEFYEFLSRIAPGNNVALTVNRGGQQGAVTLTTDQGIDQRNPLFSLFLNPQGAGNAVSWIGWHPIGPYDVSDRNAERYLGWHFNTGDANAPTRFASADQYRNNYDEGLLKRLIEQGPAGVVRPPEPPPKLNMSVSLVAENGDTWTAGYDDGVTIRQQKHVLQINIDDFPLARLKAIQWKLDDSEAQPLAAGERAGIFEAHLPDVKRGKHTVTVTPVAADPTESYSARSMTFRFLQPKPEITFDKTSIPEKTDKPRVTVKATIKNTEAAGPIAVEFELNDKTMANWTIKAGETLKVDQTVTLAEGKNSIRLQARNENAVAGTLRDETAAVTNWVYYERAPEPPVITIAEIVNPADGRPLPIQTSQPAAGESTLQRMITTDFPQIIIRGSIAAPDPLAAILFLHGEAKDGTTADKFKANQSKSFTLNQTVSLKPGLQVVRIRTSTTRAKRAEESIIVNYNPRLPTVTQVELQAGDGPRQTLLPGNDLDLQRGLDPQKVALSITLEHSNDAQPATAQLEINGQAVGKPLTIDPQTAELQHLVELQPGENVIRYRITSEWRTAGELAPSLTVNYRRPPFIASVDPSPNANGQLPDHKGKPFFDFAAKVNSDADLPLLSLTAMVNDVAATEDSVKIAQDVTDKTVWNIAIRNMPLDQGENQIQLIARNADGLSAPVEVTINQLAPAAKPEILLVSPDSKSARASSTDFIAEFNVVSDTPLTRVDLVVNNNEAAVANRVPVLQDAEKTGQPNVFRFSKLVQLSRGVNELSIEAFNEGGRTAVKTVINVVLPPITIVLDQVIPHGQPKRNKATDKSQARYDGVHFLDTAPDGHVTMRGHVEWSIDAAARKKIVNSRVVRVWVNGFLRMAQLTPTPNQPDRADFELQAVLNRSRNRVVFEHTALPVRDDNRPYFVQCNEPERQQHLHLVMVGVRKKAQRPPVKPALIEEHARQALTSAVAKNAFARIEEYRTLAGPDAVSGRIKAELNAVVNRINARARRQQLNDVVVVYYHGKEVVTDSGEFRLADYRNWRNPAIDRSSISSSYLSHMLNNKIPGAHLVLLDVNHFGQKVAQAWPHEPHLGVLRINTANEVHLLSELQRTRPVSSDGREIRLKQIEYALRQSIKSGTQASTLDSNVPIALEELVLGAQ